MPTTFLYIVLFKNELKCAFHSKLINFPTRNLPKRNRFVEIPRLPRVPPCTGQRITFKIIYKQR